MTETQELTPHVWTYLGRRLSASDKIAYKWRGEKGGEGVFNKAPARLVVGGRYRVDATDDEQTARITSAEFIDLPESEALPAWISEDRAAVAESEGIKAAARLKAAEPEVLGALTLRELRIQMRRALPSQRQVLLAVALDYLQRGR